MPYDDSPSHAGDDDNKRPSFPMQPLPYDAWDTQAGEAGEASAAKRLDFLLPADGETGVVTFAAAQIYMDAMIELVSRHNQSLSLLCLAVDDSPILKFLGNEGAALIGRAVARCMRQETRSHDVIGRSDEAHSISPYTFLITCPLLTEEQAANLAERLRAAMTTHNEQGERPWLTLSVGVASLSLDITDSTALIARSMDALRRARRAGGGRVWRHTDTMRALMGSLDVEDISADEKVRDVWNEENTGFEAGEDFEDPRH